MTPGNDPRYVRRERVELEGDPTIESGGSRKGGQQ